MPAERALLETTVRDALERAARDPGPKVDDVLARARLARDARRRAARRDRHRLHRARRDERDRDGARRRGRCPRSGVEPRADLAVLLPPFGAWAPPARTDGDVVHAHGLATARVTTAHGAARRGGRPVATLCTVTVPIDSGQRVAPCAASIPTPASTSSASSTRRHVGDAARRNDVGRRRVAAGRRAVAHQIAGACRAMLDLACAHARRTGAVRPPDRALPGRAPPARRRARRGRGARSRARRGVGRAEPA